MKKTLFEQNGGTYRQVGDYVLPNITISEEETKHIGIWGQRHLQKYRKKVGLTQGQLAEKLGVTFQAVSKW